MSGAQLTGAGLTGIVVLFAALAPFLSPHDPRAIDDGHRLESPSATYPAGTDQLGRCVLSRSLHGARVSLLLALCVVAAGATIGTLLGGTAGFAGGFADWALGGVVDLLLALPRLVVALVTVGFVGPSIPAVVLVLVLFEWAAYARVARAVVLKEKELDYVLAERALGFSPLRILLRSLVPATYPHVGAYSVLRLGGVLLAIAGLGFLGLGVPPPAPEWGSMIGEGRIYLRSAPWIVLFPSALMVLTVIGFGLLSDGRQALRTPGVLRAGLA